MKIIIKIKAINLNAVELFNGSNGNAIYVYEFDVQLNVRKSHTYKATK